MSGMRVLFRVDATVSLGTGHLMRCLTLADALASRQIEIAFAGRISPASLAQSILRKGYRFVSIDEPTDGVLLDAKATQQAISETLQGRVSWIVVDHYGLDAQWERLVRPVAARIMVIDDLANRQHDCDLLLDQNFYVELEKRYLGLVPDTARCLLGPDYVLLRPEFAEARQRLRHRDGSVQRLVVFFGGSDPTNQTQQALEGIQALGRPDISVDVIVGGANPFRNEIEAFCASRSWATYHCQISNMAELIAAADLGIGAGGAAMWERCALGLPTLTVVFADNQVRTTEDVAKTGAIVYLGWADKLSSSDYAAAIGSCLLRPEELTSISDRALALIGVSNNGAESIVRAMAELTIDARGA